MYDKRSKNTIIYPFRDAFKRTKFSLTNPTNKLC